MKSHFGMGILLYIFCTFSQHLFIGTPMEGCFCNVHLRCVSKIERSWDRIHWANLVKISQMCICMFINIGYWVANTKCRSSHLEVFFVKGVLKICSKCTDENPCRSVISIKLLRTFIEITLRHGCSTVNLLHIFRTPSFTKNTSEWLLLKMHFNFELSTCQFLTITLLVKTITSIPEIFGWSPSVWLIAQELVLTEL